MKKGQLDDAGYKAMIAATTQLNTPGTRLGKLEEVHALTDVTGFGLAGHLLEIKARHPVQDLHFRLSGPVVAHLHPLKLNNNLPMQVSLLLRQLGGARRRLAAPLPAAPTTS